LEPPLLGGIFRITCWVVFWVGCGCDNYKHKRMQKKVKVKPNSKIQKIEEQADGSLSVHLKSPPVDGKANEELIKLLAEKFDVLKSHITIKSGLSSRQKLVEIDTE
jgi:hypothetical protein